MEIKLAIDRYDRHFPFFDGSLSHSFDFVIRPFQVGQSATLQHGTDRHELFLDGQFDVAEFSMSSFLACQDQRVSDRWDTGISETVIQHQPNVGQAGLGYD